jgi:hypothetical protein
MRFNTFALDAGLSDIAPDIYDDLSRTALEIAAACQSAQKYDTATSRGGSTSLDGTDRLSNSQSLSPSGCRSPHDDHHQHQHSSSLSGTDMTPIIAFRVNRSTPSRDDGLANTLTSWDTSASQGDRNLLSELPQRDPFTLLYDRPGENVVAPPPDFMNWNFSFHETTFSGRLHKACVERAYNLLAADTRGQDLEMSFKFRLFKLDFDTLRDRAKSFLQRPTSSCANFMQPGGNVPGTYSEFAMFGAIGVGSLNPNDGLRFRRTPQHSWVVTGNVPGLEPAEYEGEWLRPDDVGAHLEAKGISVDNSTSRTTLHVVLETYQLAALCNPGEEREGGIPRNITASAILAQGRYPTHEPRMLQQQHPFDLSTPVSAPQEYYQAGHGSAMPMEISQSHTYYNSYMATAGLSLSPGHPPRSTHSRSINISLDLDLLVETLVQCSTCLGSTPGFRRYDIDTALSTVLQAAEKTEMPVLNSDPPGMYY